jgi:Flp pilus assembly protein TadB
MENKNEAPEQASEGIQRLAAKRARERARNARWDLNVAVFLFAILILVIILVTYTKMGIEVVAPIAVFGLAMVWLVGWRRGRELYDIFYEEELADLEQDLERKQKPPGGTIEETIEEKVQKALRERWR